MGEDDDDGLGNGLHQRSSSFATASRFVPIYGPCSFLMKAAVASIRTSKSKYLPKSFLFGSAAVEIVSNMLEFSLVYALLSTITTKVSIEEGGKKERQQQIT